MHISIPYSPAHIERIRRITGRMWQAKEKVWFIPYTTSAIQEFMNQFNPNDVQIAPELWVESEDLQQWKASKESSAWSKEPLQQALTLRGYSRKTIKAYCKQIERFLSICQIESTAVTTSVVQTYCLNLLERGISHSSVNQTISAIRFYCKHVLHHPTEIQYIRPKKQTKLPQVLSEKEVAQLLTSVTNLKHKTILFLTYSSGLRVGEVVRLRCSDLDIERQTLIVRQGKARRIEERSSPI
ncbi:phage integrase N-terminal SAM-like domain-containing protein [Paenibacillus sp. ACRSA]|uniref:tyrosine-type recombinase/integrase n=1 Tax=Paenibacillus sp. ACRSA TaxID=2918211 RepID=UPI001EF5E148|nr:phage integrase N-terminal SAM-like domain-containing protein [Paenibacillus sp. ACRSA]MCG7377254.1 phage integrase N-terminal SAM-like domain-containing protein [Paenibacillus sp. ACRSA]